MLRAGRYGALFCDSGNLFVFWKFLNEIFVGRTVLVIVHTIPRLSMRDRRACALQLWADLQKIFSMLQ